jgi:hypothetical protein
MRKVDVWAIGCVVYELCSGEPLFKWSNDREKYKQLARVYDEDWVSPQLPAPSAGWQEVVDAMLMVNPEERLLPGEVLRLPIFECAPDSGRQGPARVFCRGAQPRCGEGSSARRGFQTIEAPRGTWTEAPVLSHGRTTRSLMWGACMLEVCLRWGESKHSRVQTL